MASYLVSLLVDLLPPASWTRQFLLLLRAMSLVDSRLLLWPLVATGTTIAATSVSFIVWLAYLSIVKMSDPLTELPGTHLWSQQAAQKDDIETWARSRRNAPGKNTPLNLRLPSHYPVRYSLARTLGQAAYLF